jgi:DNA-binding NarL/FixJ family response regulator
MPPPAAPITVAIIEDQQVLREGLAFLINGTEGFRCTGSFGSVEQALRTLADDLPQVVLVDIGLPGMSGIDGIRVLKQRWPQLLLIVLTVYEDDQRIFDALCAGASGYLLKRTALARLVEFLREAVSGGAPISPEVALRVITLFRDVRPPDRADHNLTPHELRLLKMLVEGHSYKTAATDLRCSINTIGTHIQSIYRKLHVHSKSEAVAKALRGRLV